MSPTRFAVMLLCLGLLPSLRAQDLWTLDTGVSTTANLWSVAYGGRTLVVAGELGTLLTYSYDDQSWTPRASGGREWLVGVGYGNGRFVVVGDRGIILTSDDSGETWTPRVSGTTIRLNNAVYGNGRWLVVGEQGVVLTSVDGTTWESRPALGTGFLRALAYGQGRWLIGGASGALYTTTDAVTFTPVSISTTEDIEGAAIAANRYWIVGSGALLATATSLEAWTLNMPTPGQRTLRGVTVRNQSEASVIGDRFGYTFMAAYSDGVARWSTLNRDPNFLGTAITQGLDELVSVGFGGSVARSPTTSVGYVASETSNAPYGTEARYRVVSTLAPTAYQWQRDGAAIPGETGPELVLRDVKPATHNGLYSVRLTTGQGTISLSSLTRLNVVPAGRPEVRDTTFNSALPTQPSLVVPQPDGKIIVAGPFSIATSVGPTYGLARLNRDGTIDTSFRAGDGIGQLSSVSHIALLSDGRMYVTGSFTQISGQARSGLARLLPNGAIDLDFNPASVPFPSRIAAAPDGRLLVQTNLPAPDYRRVVLRLNRDGTRDTTVELIGYDLVGVDGTGRIYATRQGSPSVPQLTLTRFLVNGTPDASYPSVGLPLGMLDHFYNMRIVGDAIFTTIKQYGSKMGAWESYARVSPSDASQPPYQVPPSAPQGAISHSSGYMPDGTLVTINAGDGEARFYLPNGQRDHSHYASLPDLTDYVILSVTESALYVIPRSNYRTTPSGFIRVNILTGLTGRLTNLSVRAQASVEEPLIAGFVTSGGLPTSALIRAIGPTLATYGVTDGMADPRLTLTRNGTNIGENDNWPSSLGMRFSAVGAFPLPGSSRDAALETSISDGNHTAIARPATGGPGTALVELYESTHFNAPVLPRRLINISARGPVRPGDPLIAGFAISGDVPVSLLIRGAGPALAPLGVNGTLSNPRLTLYRGNTSLWENDNAEAQANTVATQVGAFAFVNGSRDGAMLVALPPGSYTAMLENVDNTSGNALIEVYEAP